MEVSAGGGTSLTYADHFLLTDDAGAFAFRNRRAGRPAVSPRFFFFSFFFHFLFSVGVAPNIFTHNILDPTNIVLRVGETF